MAEDSKSSLGDGDRADTINHEEPVVNKPTTPKVIINNELIWYNPPVQEEVGYGSTSLVARLRPGVVLKYPRFSWENPNNDPDHWVIKDIKHSFNVEEQLLNIIGPHPNIIEFLGPSEDPRGLLFAEANRGSLQNYLDTQNDTIDLATRIRWRTQAAAAVVHIHQKGVIHSDQRPENYLVHSDENGVLNICLCDFGGSFSEVIDGLHLPDSGFSNPRSDPVSTESTDIFSLGSVFYAIMTGHWPYRAPGRFESSEEQQGYGEMVDAMFMQQKFPRVEHLVGGEIIRGCWWEEYKEATYLLRDQELLSRSISA